jgi:hypothetical protein
VAAPGLFSDEWLAACNEALAAPSEVMAPGTRLVVTEHVTGAPDTVHSAITLVADDQGVRLVGGEVPGATAWLTIAMVDAAALHDGTLTPAAALTEGRLRVRGDLRAVVDAVGLLASAHASMRARSEHGTSRAAPGRTG